MGYVVVYLNVRNIMRYIAATYQHIQVQLSAFGLVRNHVSKWEAEGFLDSKRVKTPSYKSTTTPVESLLWQNPP